ncbi:MAG: hypothetical protein GX837_06665 [Methanomicrobiales archaeon]|nr:hypothetical protein [Methanomicrobiales archaeon]
MIRYALDPVTFAREQLGFDPDPWQVEVLRSPAKRLILNCSRQAGKSTTTAIAALHRAVFYPDSLILLVSPSLRQSSELFKKVTGFLDALDTRPRMTEDNRLSFTLENGSRVVSLPGTEATIRGFSAPDLVIEDESARVPDALYFSIRPMLAVSGGRLILMSTPFGKRGHFFEAWSDGGDDWQRIKIPASRCPRIAPEFLEQERRAIGDWWFEQEYLCEFRQTTDSVFRYDDVMGAVSDDVRPLFAPAEATRTPTGLDDDIAPLFFEVTE